MTSPFHEAPGQVWKHGNLEFEWRSLLETPCYGFSGPNACYSSTCTHNSPTWDIEKMLAKVKQTNSSKYKSYNGKNPSNCERVTDYSALKATLINKLPYSQPTTYEKYDYNGDVLIKAIGSEWNKDLSPSEKRKDFNQLDESTEYVRNEMYDSPLAQCLQQAKSNDKERTSPNSSHEFVVSVKKYAFNPLSEPFHPTQSIYSRTTSYTSSSETSESCPSECSSPQKSKFHSEWWTSNDKEFVCILCPNKFTTLDELQKHLEEKIDRPYECAQCDASYTNSYLLDRHMKFHPNVRKSFKCRGCHKKFRNLNQLGKHFDECRFNLYMFI